MTTAPALSVPRIRFSDPTEAERLTSVVLGSPRLLAVVPAEELTPLFAAYAGATRAAAKARLLPAAEPDDAVSKLDARLRAGEEVDPAALVDELAAAQAARDSRERTVALLTSMPSRYSAEIVSVVGGHVDRCWEALAEALDDLLDRAAVVVADLGGIDSADAAIDAGKAQEWTRLKSLVREYASLRADHFALLRAEDDRNFYNNAPALAFAYCGGLTDEFPAFIKLARREVSDLTGRPVALPFPIFDVDAVDHLLTVTRLGGRLRPHVGRPAEALDAMTEASLRVADGSSMEPGPLTAHYGGEENVLRNRLGSGQIVYTPRPTA